MNAAALIPIIIITLGFVGYCLFDLRAANVRYLPKWAWTIVILISVPVGGIVYLALGRTQR